MGRNAKLKGKREKSKKSDERQLLANGTEDVSLDSLRAVIQHAKKDLNSYCALVIPIENFTPHFRRESCYQLVKDGASALVILTDEYPEHWAILVSMQKDVLRRAYWEDGVTHRDPFDPRNGHECQRIFPRDEVLHCPMAIIDAYGVPFTPMVYRKTSIGTNGLPLAPLVWTKL